METDLSAFSTLDPKKKRVVILANPRAGAGKSLRLVEALVGSLRGRGLSPVLCWEREALTETVRKTGSEEIRCTVAAGGDGTLLEVLNRVPEVPVALLPLGNENLVARFCGQARSGREVASVIAAGRVRHTDLGRINGRFFCVMAGVGLDGEVVRRVHARRKGHINKLSYAVPILQSLSQYEYPTIEVELPETGEVLRGAMAFVFNIPQYALGLHVAPGAEPADGLLDVYVFEKPGLLALSRYFWAILGHRQQKLPDHHHRAVRHVLLRAATPVPVQTDGDFAGWLPAAIEVVPQALALVAGREERTLSD
jgi:diacylglycerol kinase family enzyme